MPESDTDSSDTYRCFGGCGAEFDTLEEMTPVEGEGDRSPRHFCDDCAERIRRGPPIADGGQAIVCDDCGHVRETTEPNPTLVSCEDCGSHNIRYADTGTER